jgi:hypothetical protein
MPSGTGSSIAGSVRAGQHRQSLVGDEPGGDEGGFGLARRTGYAFQARALVKLTFPMPPGDWSPTRPPVPLVSDERLSFDQLHWVHLDINAITNTYRVIHWMRVQADPSA